MTSGETVLRIGRGMKELTRGLTELGDVLDANGVGARGRFQAELVFEEMVTNVVDHARTPFRLVVRLNQTILHIAVHDHSPQQVRVQALDLGRPRGRGLLMIAGIATRWGSDADDNGKTMWAEISI